MKILYAAGWMVLGFLIFIINLLGCEVTYQVKPINEPVRNSDGFDYRCKLISKTYKVFGINIYTKKL